MSVFNKTHFILLNGAPGAGKDTFARTLMLRVREQCPSAEVYIDRFAKALNDAVKAAHGLSDLAYATLEASKNNSSPLLHGRSLRECKIQMGEQYFKGLFGRRIAGDLLVDRVRNRPLTSSPQIVIVPDFGFEAEGEALVCTPAALTVVRIEREGHDFSKDSRSYVDTLGVHATIHNDGSIDDLSAPADALIASRVKLWNSRFTF